MITKKQTNEKEDYYFYSVFTRRECGPSIVANAQSVESGLNLMEVLEKVQGTSEPESQQSDGFG